jgi:RNA polymerase sigma-70 factor, ECF subfamily
MTHPGHDPRPDIELVRAFQGAPDAEAGRRAAAELLRRYRDRLYAWCFRQLRDHDLALECAQETLIAAHRALPGFAGRAEYSSWLFAIARYRCVSALRARARRPDDDSELDGVPDPAPDPEAALLAREEHATVLALMNEVLEPDERTALWLRAHEEMPVEEISRLLDVPGPSGARALLQRARRKLRAALAARDALDEGGRSR